MTEFMAEKEDLQKRLSEKCNELESKSQDCQKLDENLKEVLRNREEEIKQNELKFEKIKNDLALTAAKFEEADRLLMSEKQERSDEFNKFTSEQEALTANLTETQKSKADLEAAFSAEKQESMAKSQKFEELMANLNEQINKKCEKISEMEVTRAEELNQFKIELSNYNAEYV